MVPLSRFRANESGIFLAGFSRRLRLSERTRIALTLTPNKANTMNPLKTVSVGIAIFASVSALAQPQPQDPQQQPQQQQPQQPAAPTSATSQRFADRPAVTIKEFRTSVAEVTPRGATDMFMTALIKTRKFRVLERARLSEGINTEKALNQQGMTTGPTGQSQYVAATYMFEATVSEASAEDKKSSFGIGIFGAGAKKSFSEGSIAIDVRVTDVESGVVVDAIDVRKKLTGEETSAGGLTSAIGNAVTSGRTARMLRNGAASDEYVSARKDSIDKALREAIEEAVNTIAKRFGADDEKK
jgi:curli biogenesis system outer membrane secretion channel CsgG